MSKWQGIRVFFRPFVAMMFVMSVLAAALPGTPTLAGPPEPSLTEPEPVHIRLAQPLALADVPPGSVTISQVDITADPGTWYNVKAEEFDGASFPPAGWSVETDGGTGWARHTDEYLSANYSAGVEATTSGALDTWLILGGDDGLTLEDMANARLHFSFWLDTEKDAVFFGWATSTDRQNFYGSQLSGSSGGNWVTAEQNLRDYIGAGPVWVAFFVRGQDTRASERVYVDNVTVQGQEPFKFFLPQAMNNYTPPATSFTFSDNFTDTGSGWPHQVNWGGAESEQLNVRGYSNKLMADYAEGAGIIDGACRQSNRYFMRVGNANAPRVIVQAPVEVDAQFTFEADIAYCDTAHNASTGLVFGLNDAETEFYRVILIYDAVDGTVKYAIWRNSATEALILRNTSSSNYLKNGYQTNRVKIVRNGCHLEVWFNGSKEWQTDSECHYTDRRPVGLFHDRYSYYGYTGSTVFNLQVEGAYEPGD